MAQVPPFYCLQQLVYHSNDDCPQARSIPTADQQAGRGGKTECLCCRNLNKVLDKKGRLYGIMRRLAMENGASASASLPILHEPQES